MLTAHYDRKGYWIESEGLEIYRAGNYPPDSGAYTSEGGLSLTILRAYAEKTALELSKKRNEPYVGAQCAEEED